MEIFDGRDEFGVCVIPTRAILCKQVEEEERKPAEEKQNDDYADHCSQSDLVLERVMKVLPSFDSMENRHIRENNDYCRDDENYNGQR